jgi:hypothetical protein
MKFFKLLCVLLTMMFSSGLVFGQNNETVKTRDSSTARVQKDPTSASNLMKEMVTAIGNLRDSIEALRESVENNSKSLDSTKWLYDRELRQLSKQQNSLKDSVTLYLRHIEAELASLKQFRSKTDSKIEGLSLQTTSTFAKLRRSVQNKFLIFIVTLVIILIAFFLGFIIAKRRLAFYESVLEKDLKLDTKLATILESQLRLNSLSGVRTNEEQSEDALNHALPIRVGEEVYRMRLRIANMDESTKGVTALKNSLSRLEDEFNAGRYAIKDLTGQTYVEEMAAIVKSWEPNDEIKPGEQRIVRMIKPQILHEETVVSPGEIVVGISVSDSIHSDRRE